MYTRVDDWMMDEYIYVLPVVYSEFPKGGNFVPKATWKWKKSDAEQYWIQRLGRGAEKHEIYNILRIIVVYVFEHH